MTRAVQTESVKAGGAPAAPPNIPGADLPQTVPPPEALPLDRRRLLTAFAVTPLLAGFYPAIFLAEPSIMPLGLLLGVVMALGRLYHEGEMVAARACGYGGVRAWLPVTVLALPVVVLSAWLNLQFSPQAAARRAVLTAEAVRQGLAVPFEVGRFRSFDGGRTVVYARSADALGELQRVFIKQTQSESVVTTVAQRARRELGPDGLSQTIVLLDGERVEGIPGSRRYRILRFRELSVPLAAPMMEVRRARVDERPSSSLLRSTDLREQAELQWRLGFPLMVLIAAACAVPLGRLRPRQGRYERVWRAVLLFVIYGQLAVVPRSNQLRAATPAVLGLWWVHALFLALALWLVWGQEWQSRRVRT